VQAKAVSDPLKKPLSLLCAGLDDVAKYTQGLASGALTPRLSRCCTAEELTWACLQARGPASRTCSASPRRACPAGCVPPALSEQCLLFVSQLLLTPTSWLAQYTLILPASKQLPKACIRDKRGAAVCKLRRTVGVRLPADPICDAILQGLSRPLLCTSVRVQRPDSEPGSQWLADPARIRDELGSSVDFVIDAGLRAVAPSTVVDLSGPMPRLLRRGKGDWCACKPCELRCSGLRVLTRCRFAASRG
jgi:hypothetical protein